MLFVGLDLSLNGTGCAMLSDKGEAEHSKIVNPKSLRGPRRLAYVSEEVMGFLPADRPVVVSVEGYAMGARGNNMFDIGELGGVIKLELFRRGSDVCLLVPPPNLKQFVTGSGNADKGRVVQAINRLMGLDLKTTGNDHNLADAWGLAMMARHWYRKPRQTEYETAAMRKVKPCYPIPFRPKRV